MSFFFEKSRADIGVDDIYRHARRLVLFDMDSTLIQGEAINELASVAGVGDRVAQITAAGMQAKMDFKESLTQRVMLLKGLSEHTLATVAENMVLTEGAERVIDKLKQTIAVGDSANDLPMISIAGLGVAFNAKPIVRQNAQRSISNVGLDSLLYLMRISEREIRQRLTQAKPWPLKMPSGVR